MHGKAGKAGLAGFSSHPIHLARKRDFGQNVTKSDFMVAWWTLATVGPAVVHTRPSPVSPSVNG